MITVNNIKQLTLAALLLLLPSVAIAQNNEHALAKAVEEIVTSNDLNSKYVDEFVEEIYQKHGKKSAVLTSRIAKAFYMYSDDPTTKQRNFGRREPDTAMVYVNRAIAIDPKYPQPYIIAADIVKYEPSYGERDERLKKAMDWLNKGIAANPTDSSLYVESAKLLALTDVNAATEKLYQLKEKDAAFPADLQLGRIYYDKFDLGGSTEERFAACEKAVEYFSKVDLNDMTLGDLSSFCLSINFTYGDHKDWGDKWYEVSSFGVRKYPDDFGLRMFLFYACWATEKWDEAISSAQKMFEIDSTKVQELQYYRYALCLKGAKRYDEAIEEFEKMKLNPVISEKYRSLADQQLTVVIRSKVNVFTEKGEFQQALQMLKPYIDRYSSSEKQNDNLCLAHGDIYKQWANKLEGAEQEEKYYQADRIFAAAVTGSKENKLLFCSRRYESLVQLDKTATKGVAVSAIKEMEAIAAVEAKEDPSVLGKLYGPYNYMRAYSVNNDKYEDAVEYAEKILDLNPMDQPSLEVLRVFGNKVGKKRK